MINSESNLANSSLSSQIDSLAYLQSEQESTSNNQCRSLIPLLKSRKSSKKRSNLEGETVNKNTNTNFNNKKGKTEDKTTVVNNNLNNNRDILDINRSEPGPSGINQRSNSRGRKRKLTRSNSVIKSNLLGIANNSEINIEQNVIKLKKFNLRHSSGITSSNKHTDLSNTELNLNTVNSSDNINTLNGVAPITHKYRLRSQEKHSEEKRREEYKRNSLPSSALGASTSQTSKREESLPSRLTRTGAVLRRSTRNTKSKYSP